jgi:predicted aspartyl protease
MRWTIRHAFVLAVVSLTSLCGWAETNFTALPIEVRRGHVMVPVAAGTNTFSFMLDTGYGVTMLRADHAASLQLRRAGRITIVGIAGEEPTDMFEGPTFRIGSREWKPRRVAALPTEQGGSRRRDGILGSSFFRSFVVDLDTQAKSLTLHEPGVYTYSGKGEVLALRFKGSTPIVEGTVVLNNGKEVETEFEIDTGCTGGLCIGKHFVQEHGLAPAGREGERRGVGGGARTRSGSFAELRLGKVKIQKPSADFFLEGSPVDPPLAGHIGADVLREFRIVFDYSRKQMVLERTARGQ